MLNGILDTPMLKIAYSKLSFRKYNRATWQSFHDANFELEQHFQYFTFSNCGILAPP